jgi:hypothetical protein
MSPEDKHRLFKYVLEDAATGCWNWTGGKQKNRTGMEYGYFRYGGKMRRVNRLIHETFNGPIPAGYVVRHKCDNPLCVNPKHLEAGTQRQNVSDRYERGRDFHFSGESHPMSKISETQADEIASAILRGEKIVSLARRFGVSRFGISYIRDVRRRAMIDAALSEG